MIPDDHKQAALAHLNEISPDTFDEGEFGPWTFTALEREGDTWTLDFENEEGLDGVSFEYAGDCVDANGGIVQAWFEQINQAILAWEAEVGGFGDD